jgi:hypothetical protein
MTPVRAKHPDASDKHGRLEWKLYAACAQWLRSADRVLRIILTEAGSCSPRQSTGSTWQVPLCWSQSAWQVNNLVQQQITNSNDAHWTAAA